MPRPLVKRPQETLIGSDFGAAASAGQQARKIILVEAVRLAPRSYCVRADGRNERLRTDRSGRNWQDRRPGWTVAELTPSIANDTSLSVAAFDFPFSIPLALLNDAEFARAVGAEAFGTRAKWAQFVASHLRLSFPSHHAKARLVDLPFFRNWRDRPKNAYWVKRQTDRAAGASAPLQDKYQNVFSMTLVGAAMLEQLAQSGVVLALDTEEYVRGARMAFETYPAAVADRCGFAGSYKKEPQKCFERAREHLAAAGIRLDIAPPVRTFCLEYRTTGRSRADHDPDGADAFLCLVAAICFREGLAERISGGATPEVLAEEGCIVAPRRQN